MSSYASHPQLPCPANVVEQRIAKVPGELLKLHWPPASRSFPVVPCVLRCQQQLLATAVPPLVQSNAAGPADAAGGHTADLLPQSCPALHQCQGAHCKAACQTRLPVQHSMVLLRLGYMAVNTCCQRLLSVESRCKRASYFGCREPCHAGTCRGRGSTCHIAQQRTVLAPLTCRDPQGTAKRSSLDEVDGRVLSSRARLTRSESSAPGPLRLSPIGGETRAGGTFMPLRDAIMLVSSDGTQTGQL